MRLVITGASLSDLVPELGKSACRPSGGSAEETNQDDLSYRRDGS